MSYSVQKCWWKYKKKINLIKTAVRGDFESDIFNGLKEGKAYQGDQLGRDYMNQEKKKVLGQSLGFGVDKQAAYGDAEGKKRQDLTNGVELGDRK